MVFFAKGVPSILSVCVVLAKQGFAYLVKLWWCALSGTAQ